MKKTVRIVSCAIFIMLGILFVGNAFADIIDQIASQQNRIDQGIASGSLTRREADILQDNLNWIRATFERMKADGILTPREIRRLEDMLVQSSQMISNKKHNPISRVYKADIPDRIMNQQHRINQGVANGSLTRREADILRDNLNWVKATFNRMKSDGLLTPREINRLEGMLDQSSQMIHNNKTNQIRRLY